MPVLTIDDDEEVTDTFKGTRVWWYTRKRPAASFSSITFYPKNEDSKYYRLSFHKRRRKLIEDEYLKHILQEGRRATMHKRQQRLFTNNPSSKWYSYTSSIWSHVILEHPATFETLAMDPEKKEAIIKDLKMFREGKDYYKKIGKAWKRGYLLYGPPGTGKSSMIAAIANFLEYDVYDLELTAVKTNTELRKIFIETTNKSIIVIEDIDCSINVINKSKKMENRDEDEKEDMSKDDNGKLTLSGLVLAKNYLGVEQHDSFGTIQTLLGEVNMTPADVAEGLLVKRSSNNDVGECLQNLILLLEDKKMVDGEAAQDKSRKKESSAQKQKGFGFSDHN
ncbi:P-loop containing nucleoside triphosphate hydrolases superfamily protein [Rhynchospora pubera]|uniref:P-loop containing nucleoside triphosphate hydrolases superfamily protein n=1 Tax=Rhynchospora pubera TaxID=906938 RepID=A0AAV8HX65_9POAL|nr:P-loop containing nucleoside triphosphate hydrolases superfamily protein [Rhynchospora pubera]